MTHIPRILITGSDGFIGRHLVEQLCDRCEVVAMDRRASLPTLPGVEYVLGDLRRTRALEVIRGQVDSIMHFGAPSSQVLYARDPSGSAVNTISSFIHIMEFAKLSHVDKVVYPSSGTVYGSGLSGRTREPSPSNLYGAMKFSTEVVARVYSSAVRSVGLRIFMGYGPGEERKGRIASPVCLFLEQMMRGERPSVWGSGRQSRDAIFIDDVVEIARKSLELRESFEVIDVGTGSSISFTEMIRVINLELGTSLRPRLSAAPEGYLGRTRSSSQRARALLGRPMCTFREGVRRFHDYLSSRM